MSKLNRMQGEVVPESAVAVDLGFGDVFEMRRWSTSMGQKAFELENKLRSAIDERDRFRWHGKRMMVVLEKLAASDIPIPEDFRLAISVVTGKGVDWDHRLKDWFTEQSCVPKESV